MSDVKSTILGFPNRSFHSVSDITFFLWSEAFYYYFIFVFEFFLVLLFTSSQVTVNIYKINQ